MVGIQIFAIGPGLIKIFLGIIIAIPGGED